MMPLYEYDCEKLHRTEILAPIAARPASVQCSTCGELASRIISLPVVRGAGEEYLDENLTDARDCKPFVVKSNAHKRQRLKDLGLVQKEPTYKDLQKKRTGRLTVSMR